MLANTYRELKVDVLIRPQLAVWSKVWAALVSASLEISSFRT